MNYFFLILLSVSTHFSQNDPTTFKIKSAKIVAPSLTGMQRNHTIRADSVFMKKLLIYSKKHGTHTVLYDDEDHELISKHKWYLKKSVNTFYARTHVIKNKKDTCMSMHRLILGFPKEVDHRNGNGLDNQKINLRPCSDTENRRNSNMFSNNTSGYKGVTWHKLYNKYISNIMINGKRIHLGYFKKSKDAGHAYNRAAKKYFGEFARLNKI